MQWKISPNFGPDKLESGQIDDFIDVYEDRIKGWLIEPAKALLKAPNSGFAILTLMLTYFEGHAIYRWGSDSKRKSQEYFRQAFLEVFFQLKPAPGSEHITVAKKTFENIADALYIDGRCGLFHDGTIRKRIVLAKSQAAITAAIDQPTGEDVAVIVIDREKLIYEIEAHFHKYMTDLRNTNNLELRNNFLRAWNEKAPKGTIPAPPPHILT